jgi:hypothetical protein
MLVWFTDRENKNSEEDENCFEILIVSIRKLEQNLHALI